MVESIEARQGCTMDREAAGGGGVTGAWREAGVLNSRVKPPLWPIHEWNGTSGREWGAETVVKRYVSEWTVCASMLPSSRKPIQGNYS